MKKERISSGKAIEAKKDTASETQSQNAFQNEFEDDKSDSAHTRVILTTCYSSL